MGAALKRLLELDSVPPVLAEMEAEIDRDELRLILTKIRDRTDSFEDMNYVASRTLALSEGWGAKNLLSGKTPCLSISRLRLLNETYGGVRHDGEPYLFEMAGLVQLPPLAVDLLENDKHLRAAGIISAGPCSQAEALGFLEEVIREDLADVLILVGDRFADFANVVKAQDERVKKLRALKDTPPALPSMVLEVLHKKRDIKHIDASADPVIKEQLETAVRVLERDPSKRLAIARELRGFIRSSTNQAVHDALLGCLRSC